MLGMPKVKIHEVRYVCLLSLVILHSDHHPNFWSRLQNRIVYQQAHTHTPLLKEAVLRENMIRLSFSAWDGPKSDALLFLKSTLISSVRRSGYRIWIQKGGT
jgi:hypothetical protein